MRKEVDCLKFFLKFKYIISKTKSLENAYDEQDIPISISNQLLNQLSNNSLKNPFIQSTPHSLHRNFIIDCK